jgi:hypothetical protein
VAEAIEHPARFGLCCLLPWYGTGHDSFRVDRRLKDGEHFHWHEYDLEVFQLGGQTYYTQGVMGKIDNVRTLFAGDSISTPDPACEPVLCYNDAEPCQRGWAFAIEQMHRRVPELIVAGHGHAIRDPMPVLEAKRANWRRWVEEYDRLNYRGDRELFFNPFA